MMRLLFLLLTLLFVFNTNTNAQTEAEPDAFAFRFVGNNFEWPLDNVGLARNDFKPGLQFEYIKYLNKSFNFSLPVRLSAAELPLNANNTATKRSGLLGINGLINWKFVQTKVFQPRLYTGVGGMLIEDQFLLDIPFGLGLDFALSPAVAISTIFDYHVSTEDFRNHFQTGLGIRVSVGETEPAPPKVSDRDMDGIADEVDLCPDEAGTAALNGCPDQDGDGIADGSDKCPEVAGVAQFEGCPDTDEDGVVDTEDKCPEEAGPADNDGCPITDRDNDGINDEDDQCPDEAGTLANNGCPEKIVVITAKDKITDEALPNTTVNLLDSDNKIIKSGTTNNLGIVEFDGILPRDYTVQAALNDAKLDPTSIAASEFESEERVQKTVYFDDPSFIIEGKVVYCNSPNPLPGVNLNLRNDAKNFQKTTVSREDGTFSFYLSDKSKYQLYAQKEKLLSQVVDVDITGYDRSKSVFINLEVCGEEVECGEAVRLNNILYDVNSSVIRPDAMLDLNKVVQFMRDNKDATIELSSHTDSRGRASYNLSLSQKRAQAAADYIIAQGIPATRINAQGFGETQLVNKCADGVRCSQEEHQENRRTQFKVICPE